jgi:hypothetical protein
LMELVSCALYGGIDFAPVAQVDRATAF